MYRGNPRSAGLGVFSSYVWIFWNAYSTSVLVFLDKLSKNEKKQLFIALQSLHGKSDMISGTCRYASYDGGGTS